MTDSAPSSLPTDISLDSIDIKVEEIKRERDGLRKHCASLRKQNKALNDSIKKEKDKTEEANVRVAILTEENERLQGQVMTLNDTEKRLSGCVQSLNKETAQLRRQITMNDQRADNIFRRAEEQGVTGLANEEMVEGQEAAVGTWVFLATADKEEHIARLERQVAEKDDCISQLKVQLLERDCEAVRFRDLTNQLLKDMESLQTLKELIDEDNRILNERITQYEAVTDRKEVHVEQESDISTAAAAATTAEGTTIDTVTMATSTLSPTGLRLEGLRDGGSSKTLSSPVDMQDDGGIPISPETNQQTELKTSVSTP